MSKVKFIDLWDDEYMVIRSPFLTRMDDTPVRTLMEVSDKYQELSVERNELLRHHKFINDLIDGNEPSKETYTSEDMRALSKFLDVAKRMDDYERLEIYKLGYHDCVLWMNMIGLM